MADIKEVCGTYVACFMRYGGQVRRVEDGVLLVVLAGKAGRVGGLRVGSGAIIPTRMFRDWIAMCARAGRLFAWRWMGACDSWGAGYAEAVVII